MTMSEGQGHTGITYTFTPVPFANEGESSTSICSIAKDEHLDWMLKRNPNTFRLYDAKRTLAEMEEERRQEKLNSLRSGLSIEKYMDKGYIVVDRRGDRPKFMDINGTWKDSRNTLEPWLNEREAWEWLKEEMEMIISDAMSEATESTQEEAVRWTDEIKNAFENVPEMTPEILREALNTNGIHQAMTESGRSSIYATLSRLVKNGFLVKTDTGNYKKK